MVIGITFVWEVTVVNVGESVFCSLEDEASAASSWVLMSVVRELSGGRAASGQWGGGT